MKPIVVKLGGSLLEDGTLGAWLAVLQAARTPLMIVPGGGPFADAVRDAQARMGVSDAAAHEMAILAMHQMAIALASLNSRLAPVETIAAIARAKRRRKIPVWLPLRLANDDPAIPRNWSITSDGLAARLAERLGTGVVLVKSCAVPAGASPEALAAAGIADPIFAEIVGRAGLPWCAVGPGGEAALSDFLATTRAATLPRKRSTPTPPRGTAR